MTPFPSNSRDGGRAGNPAALYTAVHGGEKPPVCVMAGTGVAWALLLLAGLFEVAWAIGLKYTDGFSRFVPSVLTLAAMGVSVWLLAVAMRSLPIGTAYAVWVGIGATGTVILGILLFGEPASLLRLISVGLIIVGIAGLKFASSA